MGRMVCLSKETGKQYLLIDIDMRRGELYYLDDLDIKSDNFRKYIIFEEEEDLREEYR